MDLMNAFYCTCRHVLVNSNQCNLLSHQNDFSITIHKCGYCDTRGGDLCGVELNVVGVELNVVGLELNGVGVG